MGVAARTIVAEQKSDGQNSEALFGRTVDALGWRFVSECSKLVLQLTVAVILARLLPVDAFGLLALAMIVINLVIRVSEIGVVSALVQRKDITDVHIRVAFTVSVVCGLVLTALIWLGAPLAATVFRSSAVGPVLRLISVSVLFLNLCSTAWALLQRSLDYRTLLITELTSYGIGYVVVSITLALLGFGVWALAWAAFAQSGIKAVLLICASPHSMRPSLSRTEMRQLLNFGVGMSLARIANFAAVSGDYFVVGRWLGATALGLYSRAYQLMTLPMYQFSSIISEVLFPAYSIVQDDTARLRRAYLSSLSLSAIVVFPVLTGLAISAPELMYGVFGPDWKDAARPLEILCIGGFFLSMYNLGDSLARAKGAVYLKFWCHAVYAICVVVCARIGSLWGITGVAVGVVAAVAVMYVLIGQLGIHLSQSSWKSFFLSQAPGVILALAVAVFALPVTLLLRAVQLPPLIILAVTATASLLAAISAGVWLPRGWLNKVSCGILVRITDHYSEMALAFRRSLSKYTRKNKAAFAIALVVYRLCENVLLFLHIRRQGLWRTALGLGRRAFRQTSQGETRWEVAFPGFDEPGGLIQWLRLKGIEVAEGAHTFYIPPQERLSALIPSVVDFYPPGSGFKILKDCRNPARARYLYEGRSLVLLRRLIGAPREQLVAANYMNSLGVGPRIRDLACWEAQGQSWTVFVVEHLKGDDPTPEQCSAFLDRLKHLNSDSHLRVLIPNWEQVPDFTPPHCNANLIYSSSKGRAQYIDFQNFALTSLDAWSKEIVARANGALHTRVAGKGRRAKNGFFSAAEREASGWPFIVNSLREASLGFERRIVLDIGCNYGLMLRCSLAEGASWVFGWDTPGVVALAQELLLSVGTTRFSLKGAYLNPEYKLEDDLPDSFRNRLAESVVFLSSRPRQNTLPRALRASSWRVLVYQGQESERLEDARHRLDTLLSDDVRILASSYINNGANRVRPMTIFLRT